MTAEQNPVLRDLGEHGVVRFTEQPRRYTLHTPNGVDKRLVSVTTVLGTLEKRALYRWHEARGAQGVIEAIRLGELDPHDCDPVEAAETVRALGLGADAAMRKAATRGLDVHGILEHWARHGDMPLGSDIAPDAKPYLKGLAAWLLKYDPVPIRTERIVCHPGLLYAGRYDLLCEIDGLTALVDLKTSRTGRPYPEAHLQMRAYADAEIAVGETEPAQILAVGVSPDGGFVSEPCVCETGAFEAVLAVYRLRAQIERDLRASRKKVEEVVA